MRAGGSRGASACMRSHSLCCLHAIPLARRHFNLDVCIHEYHVCSNISSCMSLKKENRNRAGMQRGRRASSSRASRAAEQQREMCSVQLLLSLKNWKTLTIYTRIIRSLFITDGEIRFLNLKKVRIAKDHGMEDLMGMHYLSLLIIILLCSMMVSPINL